MSHRINAGLIIGAISVVLAGCSSPAATPVSSTPPTQPTATAPTSPARSASASPTASASPAKVSLAIPKVSKTEISRSVFRGRLSQESTFENAAPRTQDYSVRAACETRAPGGVFRYEILLHGKNVTTSGSVKCNGGVTVNSVGQLKAGATPQINTFPAAQSDFETGASIGYAIIAPTPEG